MHQTIPFADELPQISSHIIFTNGLRDGWSTTSVTENLSPTIRAINFPNGAHHSDLRYAGPSDQDTEDIRLGYQQIEDNLALWLDEIKEGMVN
jgi:lysosomal Pro-X carboxypeptidase